jgi:acyl-CoA-dependent ceramide synthase
MQWDRAKTVAFGVFVLVWTYFRHWLNLVILWSVYSQSDLIPERARRWAPSEGCWFPRWIRDQILLGIGALQVLNLFWYFLILRILVRALATSNPTDERSDDEDDESNAKKGD